MIGLDRILKRGGDVLLPHNRIEGGRTVLAGRDHEIFHTQS